MGVDELPETEEELLMPVDVLPELKSAASAWRRRKSPGTATPPA